MSEDIGLVSPETIAEALTASSLKRTVSCCGVENKFCINDQYQGDLWSFAQLVIQMHDKKRRQVQEPSGNPKYMGIGECY